MTAFRALLIFLWLAIVVYTAIVIVNHGPELFSVFFSDIAKMAWPGQFNLDFLSMLTLSAAWVAWRHQFSGPGLGLALLAFLGGGLFLTTYLSILIVQTQGNMTEVLLGGRAATGR